MAGMVEQALQDIHELARRIEGLLSELPDIREGAPSERDELRFIKSTLEAWAALLSDPQVQKTYIAVIAGMAPAKTFPAINPSMITNVGAYISLVQQGLSDGTFSEVREANGLLSALFDSVVSDLVANSEVELAPSLRELIVRYAFTKKLRDADELLTSAERSASKASEAATSASEAAGTAGESIMASYFESFAKQEWESATRFRVWTIVLLSAGGVLAAVFLLLPAFGVTALALDTGDYVHLAQRVVVTAAVFAIAAYLARQSHQHRTLANWAKALSVQLKTFEAFMAPLDSNEAKEALRAQFAARVFGEPPVLRGDSSSGDSSPVPQQLWDILSRNVGKPQ